MTPQTVARTIEEAMRRANGLGAAGDTVDPRTGRRLHAGGADTSASPDLSLAAIGRRMFGEDRGAPDEQ